MPRARGLTHSSKRSRVSDGAGITPTIRCSGLLLLLLLTWSPSESNSIPLRSYPLVQEPMYRSHGSFKTPPEDQLEPVVLTSNVCYLDLPVIRYSLAIRIAATP